MLVNFSDGDNFVTLSQIDVALICVYLLLTFIMDVIHEESDEVDANANQIKPLPSTSGHRLVQRSTRTHSFRRLIKPDIQLNLNHDSDSDLDDIRTAKHNGRSSPEGQEADRVILTLDEVRHIREQVSKIELDDATLHLTRSQRQDIEAGRVCNSCLRTKFNLKNWRQKCLICSKGICSKCTRLVDFPWGEKIDNVPLEILAPKRVDSVQTKDHRRIRSLSLGSWFDCVSKGSVALCIDCQLFVINNKAL